MTNVRLTIALVVLVNMGAYSDVTVAGDAMSTFASFYNPSVGISWLVAGVVALAVGIVVFIGWPVLGPPTIAVIGSIGSSVGGLFGLSGVAATNFGLALLGGGSIVSGGFGIAGGTAVLAAALSFGTDVTMDYALGKMTSSYQMAQFSKDSATMMTLPIPVNTDGPESVEAAGEALESQTTSDAVTCAKQVPDSYAVFQACVAGMQRTQRQRVRDAIKAMDGLKAAERIDDAGRERRNAMYSLLYFLNNDYPKAFRTAQFAYGQGLKGSRTPTLPAFVGAASMLYVDRPNLAGSYDWFKYSVTAEPENPLTPILFAAYLDRLSYRINDGAASVGDIDRVGKLARMLADDDRKLVIQQSVLTYSLMQIKVTQQRVLSLVRWENRTVEEQRGDQAVVRASFRDHEQMIKTASSLVKSQHELLNVLSADPSFWQRTKEFENPFGNEKTDRQRLLDEWKKSLQTYRTAVIRYDNGRNRLSAAIDSYDRKVAKALAAQQQLSYGSVSERVAPVGPPN